MYVHGSLSVCGLVDNRSAVACVLRSLADLCSVLPPSSGLAASPSPNILYPNHTFWISSSVEDSIFRYFHYICSHSLLFPSLINSHHQMLAAGIVMFAYIPPHIFDLKTVVGRYESAGYQTNQDSVWQGMPVVDLVMAMLATLCGVIVLKVSPLLSTAVTRRQTQTCCGFKRKKKRPVFGTGCGKRTSPQPPQGNLVFPVNSRL